MYNLTIYKKYFTDADCYKKGTVQVPKGIQVHSTGANNPYLKRYVGPDDGRLGKNQYDNYHNRPGLTVCANAYIGKLNDGTPAIYQTLPWDYQCWLSGSSTKGNANKMGYIGFEICEDNKTNKAYFEEVVMGLSVKLVAYLCTKYNISVDNVKDHKELHDMGIASNHGDIKQWLDIYHLTMDDYRNAVKAAMIEGINVTYIESDSKEGITINEPVLYYAETYASNNLPIKMRSSPDASIDNNIICKIPTGTIVEVLANVNNEWDRIRYNNNNGYMMHTFLRRIKEPSTTQQTIEITYPQLMEIKTNLENALSIINQLLNI